MATDRTEAERLNRYLDAEVGGGAADPGDLDPAFEATFRRVRAMAGEATTVAAGTTPAIDPRLKQQLWRDIMSNTPGTTIAARLPRAKPRRRGWDRGMTWQALAVAALLVAMLGSLLYGPRSGSDQRTAIAPPSLQGDQAKGAAMFRQNPGRTGVSADAGPMAEPGVLWRATLQKMSFSGLDPKFAVDGRLFLIDQESGVIQAMSVETGAVLWTSNLDLPLLVGNDQVAGEGLIIASSLQSDDAGKKGTIVAIDQKTGQEIWRADNLASFQGAPLIDNGKLIYLSTDRMLRVVDAKTGKEEWHLDIAEMAIAATSGTPFPIETRGMQQAETLAVANGLVYFSAGDGVLYAVDLATHELAWHLKTEGNVISTPAIVDGDLYLPANWINPDMSTADPNEGGTLYKLDAKTGDVKWQQSSKLELRIAAVLEGHLVASSQIFSTDTGDVTGTLPEGMTEPTFSVDALYWLDQQGQLNAASYDAATGSFTPLWAVYIGTQWYSAPILSDGTLITRGPDNTVLALGGNAATPVAGSTPGTATDLSGLAPCIAPPPVDWRNVTGEPAHTLQTYTEREVDGTMTPISPGYLYQPWFDYDNVPEGTPADASVIAGIQQTFADALVCARPGNTVDDSGFYSEDYYRRTWVQERIAQTETYAPQGKPMLYTFIDLAAQWLPPVESATVLEDGRVGVLLDPAPPMVDNFALYFVFVEKDGYWVVDEVIRVGPGALQG